MKRFNSSILILGLLSLILAWSPAYAAKQVATVVAARGDVQALDAKGKSRALPVQSPIFEEDTIKTREHSRVQIMFTDNTLINLGNATTMKIAEYRWQPEQNDGALKTQVKEGTFRVMGGALTKTAPQNFKTETPTATIGIRGSMYAGVVTPDFLSVVFQGGKGINITNAFGTVEISKPGYGTKVAMSKPPLPPMKFTAKEMGEMNKALSGNGAGEKEDKKEEKKEKGPAPKGEQGVMAPPAPDDIVALGGGGTTIPPIPPVIPDVKKIGDDKIQKNIGTVVGGTVANTVITPLSLTGNYRIFRRDNLSDGLQHYYSSFLAWDSGAVSATFSTTLSGTGSLQASFASSGAWLNIYGVSPVSLLPFLTTFGPYTHPGFTPTATSYSGFTSFTDTLSYNEPNLGTLTTTSINYVDPVGQFFYNTILTSLGSAPEIITGSLIYAGVPSGSIPDTGIDKFTGHLIYTSPTSLHLDADLEETRITVNYNNKRLIGRSSDDMFQKIDDGAIFFGTVAANGTANVTILGGGDNSDVPTSNYGSATATLYGSFNQGLAFTASGADYSVIDNTQTGTWEATGAALRSPTRNTTPDPTSPIAYTGFVVGVADNTATGTVSRIFMNSAASGFTMTANPTTGVVSSGSISAQDLISGEILSGLTVGHTTDLTKSAYIANDDMLAILSGTPLLYMSNLTLRDHGNYLVTAGPDAPIITNASNDFMTWGYWEMAYTDTDGSKDHLISSQSFFVAGQPTPADYLTASFTGTYDGKAFGVRLDSAGLTATQLTNGATHLVVNFPGAGTAGAVTGTIHFDQASLAINSAASTLNTAGFFNAFVSSVDTTAARDFVNGVAPTSSAVNGAFYGLTAQAVGGNFHAQMGTGERYLGVFGGNR